MNLSKALDYINSHNLTGIKAGKNREKFLNIWMVTVGNRIFARSWGFAERSWYNTFLTDPMGEIQCGDEVFNIKAEIPHDLKELNSFIDQAYLTKYDSGDNSPYAQGIIQKEHAEKTMEIIVLE